MTNFSSKKYWEDRYLKGGNSGAGSYGRLSEFKADFINKFTQENKISSVIDFGCGDANQLALYDFKNYIGLDVSRDALMRCIAEFKDDLSKSFFLYDQSLFIDNSNIFNAEMTMSIDVIFHLVEDNVFEKYMKDLFESSKKFVIIYSSNYNEIPKGVAHVKHRKFTDWIKDNIEDWEMLQKVDNRFPLKDDPSSESFADFYIFKKK